MTERLSASQIALLLFYAGGMAAGQLLFKSAALRYAASAGTAGERLFGLVQNGSFMAAVVLYAALAVLWVWVLSFTSLSRAYPFVAIAFAITPLLGGLVFGEALPPRLFIGLLLISCGLFFVIG
jgi:drug/metabolite transporter (DMT)-like permease